MKNVKKPYFLISLSGFVSGRVSCTFRYLKSGNFIIRYLCFGFQASDASILLAKDYLEKQYKTLNKPYSMALTAYALALVNSKEKFNANDRLKQIAIYDNG